MRAAESAASYRPNVPQRRIKLDMHTHSEYSPDSRTSLANQARALKAAGIDVVCATDHNTIEGALRLREIADGVRVIVGEEVSTRDGEIIGLFLEKPIPRDLSGEETIARIRDQRGIVSALRGGEVHGRLTGSAIHLATRYDVFRKWLGKRRTKRSA